MKSAGQVIAIHIGFEGVPMAGIVAGARFGRLVAVRRVDALRWEFQCDCGQLHEANRSNVTTGKSRSCGCLMKECVSARRTKHGESKGGTLSPEYTAWRALRGRCECPTNKGYAYYGGRGIRVLWPDFAAFLADVGRRPGPGYSLDRIDNEGHYGPGNCRWATRKEQANNKRSNRLLTVGGVTKTMAMWEEEKGIAAGLIHRRLSQGWSVEAAVMTPLHPR
jgi:hypothetical protein